MDTFAVKRAKQECDAVVTSIFVNPAQFAPHEDLDKYPRTLDRDLELLKSVGTDVVFTPRVQDMYPSGISLHVEEQVGTFVEVRGMSHQLEGSIRPHFFRGVATVVAKLFNLVQPDKAYFGQKDAQQCAVLRRMVSDLFFPLEMIVGETVREADGLAMSSRNRYLSLEQRRVSNVLYRALMAGKRLYDSGETRAVRILEAARQVVGQEPGVELQYFSLAHPQSLDELSTVTSTSGAIFSGAIRVGTTRLIDNLLLDSKL